MDRTEDSNPSGTVQRTQSRRLLAANLPPVLQTQLQTAIAEEPDWELVGTVEGNMTTLLAAGDDIDLIILGALTAWPLPGICTHLLHEFPHLKLIVVSVDGLELYLYWLNLENRRQPVVSATSLHMTIRLALSLDEGF